MVSHPKEKSVDHQSTMSLISNALYVKKSSLAPKLTRRFMIQVCVESVGTSEMWALSITLSR